jgi:NAD(P)-dependent dehydrogenase (short-subunit alcohol dehydrogenase family)
MTSLSGVAIVTGAASGLGRAAALRLGAAGAHVVAVDVNADGCLRVAREIDAAGGAATACVANVTSGRDVKRVVEVARAAGWIKVLVLSAAVEVRSGAVDTSDGDWQHVLDVNLKGPFLCMREAIPAMVQGGGGSVIAFGSTLGLIVAPGYAAYCASKGALVNLCKQAALEHAADGVRVNVIAPSACESGLFMRVTEQADDPESIRRHVAANVPMARLGTEEDVCRAVLFLASDDSTYISGAVLPLDGGLAARRA